MLLSAPIGLSPLTAALPLDPLPPQAAGLVGLSPPCALPLPAWPSLTSLFVRRRPDGVVCPQHLFTCEETLCLTVGGGRRGGGGVREIQRVRGGRFGRHPAHWSLEKWGKWGGRREMGGSGGNWGEMGGKWAAPSGRPHPVPVLGCAPAVRWWGQEGVGGGEKKWHAGHPRTPPPPKRGLPDPEPPL